MPTNNASLYGINLGGAQVFDTSGLANQFAQQLAKQQAARNAELKLLADQQANIKPEGLRNDTDRKDFFDQVNNWRTKSIAALNEKDPYKRALAKAEAHKDYLAAQDLVSQSKQRGSLEKQVDLKLMDDAFRHQFTPDAVTRWTGSAKLGVRDPNLAAVNSLERAPNLVAFDKARNEIDKNLIDNAMEEYKLGATQKIGNTKQTPVTKYRQVKAEEQALRYLDRATVDNDFARVLETKYPEIYQQAQTAEDFHKAHAEASAKMAKENQLYKEQGVSFIKDDKPDNYYAHYDYRMANGGGGANSMQTPAQILIAGDPSAGIAGMQQGGAGTGEKFIALAPLAQYGGKKPKIKMDTETGEHIFEFPAQLGGKDSQAISFNKKLREEYADDPEKVGGNWLGFGKKVVPFEKSAMARQLKPEVTVKRPAQVYRLNPTSPDYLARAAEVAKEQNINLDQLNKIENKKGGRGQIQQAVGGQKPAKAKETKLSGTIKVMLNGQEGEIPADKYKDFIKKYPSAKKLN